MAEVQPGRRRGRSRVSVLPGILAGITAAVLLVFPGSVFPAAAEEGDSGGVPAISGPSAALNGEAMDAYHAEDYARAAELFREALEKDGDNYLAHYNLACTLVLNRGDLAEIYRHLERAAELSPERRIRMGEDPDLKMLRTHRRFQAIRGFSLADRQERQILVPKLLWAVRRADPVRADPAGEGAEQLAPVKMTEAGRLELGAPNHPLRGTGRWFNNAGALIWVYDEGPLEGYRFVFRLEEGIRFRMTAPDGSQWILFDIMDYTMENTDGGKLNEQNDDT